MPVTLEITYADNSTERVNLPVEIWQRGDTWTYLHKGSKKIKQVVIDPDKVTTDINLGNDSWPVEIYK